MSLSQVNTLNIFLKNNYKTLPDLFTKKLVGVIFTKGFKYLLHSLKIPESRRKKSGSPKVKVLLLSTSKLLMKKFILFF